MMNAILRSALLALIFVTIFNTVPVEGVKCWICNHLGGCTNGYGEVKTCHNPTLKDPDSHSTQHPNFVENHREWCLKISFPGTETTVERSCGRSISWKYGLNLEEGCQNVTQEKINSLDKVQQMPIKLVPGLYCTCITGDECNGGFQQGEVTKKGEIDTPPPGYTVPATRPMTMFTTPVVPTTSRSDMENILDLSKSDQNKNKDRDGSDSHEDEHNERYEDLRNNYPKSASSAGIVTAVSCLVLVVCSPAILLLF